MKTKEQIENRISELARCERHEWDRSETNIIANSVITRKIEILKWVLKDDLTKEELILENAKLKSEVDELKNTINGVWTPVHCSTIDKVIADECIKKYPKESMQIMKEVEQETNRLIEERECPFEKGKDYCYSRYLDKENRAFNKVKLIFKYVGSNKDVDFLKDIDDVYYFFIIKGTTPYRGLRVFTSNYDVLCDDHLVLYEPK
jgi:hypothetical protein